MQFYVGLHQPSDAMHFSHAFISINRLRRRQSNFAVNRWILDSGAFTELERHKRYRHAPEVYAQQIDRWSWCGQLERAVSQDYMCEPWMLELTGLSIADHQRLTIERFDAIRACVRYTEVMPVLQGFAPEEYVSHLHQYGDRLPAGAWVGVGSVCKRQGDPTAIVAVLQAIKAARPDLRLHGFGVKTTSLAHAEIRSLLYSADSMAWSSAARYEGRRIEGRSKAANDWREAKKFADRIQQLHAA